MEACYHIQRLTMKEPVRVPMRVSGRGKPKTSSCLPLLFGGTCPSSAPTTDRSRSFSAHHELFQIKAHFLEFHLPHITMALTRRYSYSAAFAALFWLIPVLSWTSHPLQTHSRRPTRVYQVDDSAVQQSIYSLPALYDLAFGYRDYDEEVDFLMMTHERLAGRPAETVVELAAGPARHSMSALALPSVRSVVAVDVSPQMAAYAQEVAAETLEKDELDCFDYRVEDMRVFELREGDPKIDTAWILLGSLQHLLENKDVIRCFQSVCEALAHDGTLILELPHPREIFSMVECTRNGWKVPLEGDDGNDEGELQIIWGDQGDKFDPITQIREFTVEMQLKGSGSKQSDLQNVREIVPTRHFTAREIEALAQIANLEVVEMFGALEEGVAVDDEDLAFRLVCVLRKKTG